MERIRYWAIVCGAFAAIQTTGCVSAPDLEADTLAAETAPYLGVRIAQVAYDTTGDEFFEEFVELYNQTDQGISLRGWALEDNFSRFAFAEDQVIPARSFLIVAKDRAAFSDNFQRDPDVDGLNLFLDNGGDILSLVDPADNMADMVAWQWFVDGWSLYAPAGDSLTRMNPDGDWGLAGDWIVRSPASPQESH